MSLFKKQTSETIADIEEKSTETSADGAHDPAASEDLKDLKKLKRQELLEIMLRQQKQIDRLKDQLAKANAELEKREISFQKAGTLTDAVMEINGVFEAAQKAAEDYVRNIRARADAAYAQTKKGTGKDA